MKQNTGFDRFNLRHLRYFLAVCEAGSFHRASHTLNIAQSAVSRRVADLEHIFGARLLDRHPRGATPSDAGAALRAGALRISHEIEEAQAALKRYRLGEEGLLRIAFFGTTSRLSFVPGLISRFRDEQPHIRIELSPMAAGEMDDAAFSSLDLAFHEKAQPMADTQQSSCIHVGRYLVAVPHGHVLSDLAAIPFARLCEEELIVFPFTANPFTYDKLVREAAKRGRSLNIIHETPSEYSRLALAAAGMGIAIVSPLAKDHDQDFEVEYRPIADVDLEFELWLSVKSAAPAVTDQFVGATMACFASVTAAIPQPT